MNFVQFLTIGAGGNLPAMLSKSSDKTVHTGGLWSPLDDYGYDPIASFILQVYHLQIDAAAPGCNPDNNTGPLFWVVPLTKEHVSLHFIYIQCP